MAITGLNKVTIECMSWRECDFYIKYLNNVGMRNYQFESAYNYDDISECSDDIQKCIEEEHQNNDEKLIKEMKLLYKKSQLTSSDFSFFDSKEERTCNWAWLFLNKQVMRFDNYRSDNSPLARGKRIVSMRYYDDRSPKLRLDSKSLEKHPCNTGERVRAIKDAFLFSEVDKDGQLKLIKLMQHIWVKIYQNKSIETWLDRKNTVQCKWAWDYIQNSQYIRYFKAWPPLNDDETYWAIQAIFDHGSWEYPDKLNLLMSSMKKAWSQKKFREKSEGKKAYSITMTPKTKDRLDELVLHHELKITEIIEKLIKKEHEKECSKAVCKG